MTDQPILQKFQHLNEVLFEEHFHSLFNEVIKNNENLSEEIQIELLTILGERFEKFYNTIELNANENKFITEQLVKLTCFSDLNRTYEINGLMFSFMNHTYYEFLTASLKTENLALKVRAEIIESIEEFKNITSDGNFANN